MSEETPSILYGEIAVREKLVTREQLDEAIRIQENSPGNPPLGEILLDLGFLSPHKHALILDLQRQSLNQKDGSTSLTASDTRVRRRLDSLFGKLAVSLEFTTPARINECIRLQAKEREAGNKVPLGRLLVDKGYVEEAQVLAILSIQEHQIVGCPPCGKWYRAEDGKALTTCKHCGNVLRPATEMGALDPRDLLAGAAETMPGSVAAPPDITQYVDETKRSLQAVGADLRVRPPSSPPPAHLGRLAVELGMVTQLQLDECLALQRRSQLAVSSVEPPPKPLGRILQECGYISPQQVSKLLVEQERRLARDGGLPAHVVRRTQIGELAVQQGFLGREELHQILSEQARNEAAGYKQLIGKVLLDKGVLAKKDLEHLARRQRRIRRIAKTRQEVRTSFATFASIAAACLVLVVLGFLLRRPASDSRPAFTERHTGIVNEPEASISRSESVVDRPTPPRKEIQDIAQDTLPATPPSSGNIASAPDLHIPFPDDAPQHVQAPPATKPSDQVGSAATPPAAPEVSPVKVDHQPSPFDLIEDAAVFTKAGDIEKQGGSALRELFAQIRNPPSSEARLRSLELALCMSDRVTEQIVALSPRSRWPSPPRAKIVPDGPGHTATIALPNRDAAEGPDYALAGRFELVTNWFPDRFRLDVGGLDPGRARMKFIIIHTAEGTKAGTISWFRNPKSRASAHYVVGLDGEVVQMVAEADTAFHGGGATINPYSIGIEHEGYAHRNTWTRPQVLASALLVRYLCQKYRMPLERTTVLGHYETEPRTRTDPGPHFKWTNYLSLVRGVATKR